MPLHDAAPVKQYHQEWSMPYRTQNIERSGTRHTIDTLSHLQAHLASAHTVEECIELLRKEPVVVDFLRLAPLLKEFLVTAKPTQACILLKIVAIGQGPQIISHVAEGTQTFADLAGLADLLAPTEAFYEEIGGIVGYQLTTLKLLRGDLVGPFARSSSLKILKPHALDIREQTAEVWSTILTAINHWPAFAEIYVVGGAGDRLDLRDALSGEALPAAKLAFDGRSLLEGLLRDVEAREYLHYKLFGKQVVTPIAMMTSSEKDNHAHITCICEQAHWFGRPKDSFRLFCQPSSPVVTIAGDWASSGPCKPLLKPGGHGAIWKLAHDSGVFDWLESLGRSKLLIRQINNPVASTDYGLLAFLGTGFVGGKSFGVASCDRLVNAAEGMSVLIETAGQEGFDYRMTNIEYTEFERHGLKDVPATPGAPYSTYPANTNILFADLQAVRAAANKYPLPGLLINTKTMVSSTDSEGNTVNVRAGRLETMMQNIADVMSDHFAHQLPADEPYPFQTYATYYNRRKTLSTTKSSLSQTKHAAGTPEGCFYDVQANYRELLTDYCHWSLPDLPTSPEDCLSALPFLVHIHPAAGPLFSIIGQKIQRGTLTYGSELYLEIADIELADVTVDGSLYVVADNVTGHLDDTHIHHFSDQTGKCTLRNVTVRNRGIDHTNSVSHWKRQPQRQECCVIRLQGNGEFFAEGVTLPGALEIVVANGERVVASQDGDGQLQLIRTPIPQETWSWKYVANEDGIWIEK